MSEKEACGLRSRASLLHYQDRWMDYEAGRMRSELDQERRLWIALEGRPRQLISIDEAPARASSAILSVLSSQAEVTRRLTGRGRAVQIARDPNLGWWHWSLLPCETGHRRSRQT